MSGATYQIALFLYGRGEYFKTGKRETPKTENCWVCGEKLLNDGTAIWPTPWFGLHRICAPKTFAQK